jgi:hypothetical protein
LIVEKFQMKTIAESEIVLTESEKEKELSSM